MSQSAIEDIERVLREKFSQPERVLGSYLGNFIQTQLPAVDLKVDFGGLKSLIHRHFQSHIVEVGRRGSDLELLIDFTRSARLDGVGSPTPEQAAPPLPRTRQRHFAINAWRAVANPSSIIRAGWNPLEHKLELLAPDAPYPQELLEFRPITYDELNQITQTFLAERQVVVPREKADPAEPRRYGPRIMATLREMGLFDDWDEYRTERVLRLIGGRLLSLGATEKTANRILSEIRASKPQQVSKTLPINDSRPLSPQPPQKATTEDQRLRAFFVRAVQAMSIDELRELRLSGATIEKALDSE